MFRNTIVRLVPRLVTDAGCDRQLPYRYGNTIDADTISLGPFNLRESRLVRMTLGALKHGLEARWNPSRPTGFRFAP